MKVVALVQVTHHEWLINGIFQQMRIVFQESEQAIYLYLDDNHKICNEKFSSLLGYSTPEEWAESEESFVDTFVDEASRRELVDAYARAIEKMSASTIKVAWKKKTGERVDTTVILVPLAYEGHIFGLHFVY